MDLILEAFTKDGIGVLSIGLLLKVLVSTVLGYLIFFTIQKSKLVFINEFLHKSTIILPLIVTGIMFFVGSSISMSIGLLGSLSIVRFRTSIKNPMEILFLLWCILIGIGVGSGHLLATVVLSLCISVLIIVCERLIRLRGTKRNVVHVEASAEILEKINLFLKDLQYISKLESFSYRNNRYFYYFDIEHDSFEKIAQGLPNIESVISVQVLDK